MGLKVGDKAPLFELYNDREETTGLKDFAGRNVIVLFFPLAFTGVCTEELCTVRDGMSRYQKLGTDVVAISVDSVFTLQKFKQAEGLNFPLLSDFNKEVSRQYGALYDTFVMGMEGVSKRAAFVIDGEGVVRYAEVLKNAGDQPDYSAIETTLTELQ